MAKTVTVTVPATTANLGPGFDCIGAALTLYNKFKFTKSEAAPSLHGETVGLPPPDISKLSNPKGGVSLTSATAGVTITVTGKEADRVNTDESNLVYQAFVKFYQHIGQMPPSVQIEIQLGVPLARGLGSSATAIVGGLVGANLLAGSLLEQHDLIELAIALEGHPDNVVPAMLGGCRLAATSETGWEICDVPWHESIVPVVAIPNFELSTQEARRVLPAQVSRADAIFNAAHLGLLVRGLETGKRDWINAALQDKLHQPYRQALIPGYQAVHAAAMGAGALGIVISGAGPTLLALVSAPQATDVEVAMNTAWQEQGITAEVRSLSIDSQGFQFLSV